MADATLTTNQEGTSITQILNQGAVYLTFDKNSKEHDFTISTEYPQTLSFDVIGIAGPCAINASGTMKLSAIGYCDEGIVYLKITEDWQETNGTASCDDVVKPFTLPPTLKPTIDHTAQGKNFLSLMIRMVIQ